MGKQFYSDDELVERLWDYEDIKQLMAKHFYLYAGDERRKELTELWVKLPQNRRSASLGVNTGFYSGMEDISNYYVVQLNELRYTQLKPYTEADPSLDYGKQNLGRGILNHSAAYSPLIQIAEDGRTAKYMCYNQGARAVGNADGSADCRHMFGLLYADLLKEQGEWKIWHLIITNDHAIPAGKPYSDYPEWEDSFGTSGQNGPYRQMHEDPNNSYTATELGDPTIKRVVYDPFFGWEHLYEDMPHPYYSYNPLHSYGPEGDFGMPYYERERRNV